ncbi:PREDICTED: uncharacterized protein LOC103325343 [Prunus mume]|uniref:Uncharacterized protein LOC103325343 n=1 Tax=Prunus mume TaxID=102107 RepID=A0ABM0NJJ4_PRUMU|nr:PREDICTED: uncharacterized protein LOC103325343 [Prunus mume]
MEFASCSILRAQPFSTFILPANASNSHLCASWPSSKHNLSLALPFFSSFPRNSTFPGKCQHCDRFTAFSSISGSQDQNPSQKLAVLLEVDGVLMDAYRLGNRQTFNAAFRKLGLDCASWTEPVYLDLLRKSAGDEEKMLNLYFNRTGWPSSLPTSEKASFVKKVLQNKKIAMDEFLMSESLPLRPGVEEFIDDAYNEGIPVVILTAYSKSGDEIARSIAEKLGQERISKLKIIGDKEVDQSLYGQLANSNDFSSGMDEQLAKEAIKAVSAEKQRIAEEVASLLKLNVEIDTTPSESLEKVIATLRAGAENAGLPVCDCVLIAGSQSGVTGAERVGMPCVVLRSSLTARAEFPSANATMDGFGGADLTITKLRNKRGS